jgi:mRNA-degrading endonuclease RelE of RelBE toxin-antitoxin system
MVYEVILKPSAERDLERLRKYDAVLVVDGIEKYLTRDARMESKTRIKKLRGMVEPDYRLRIQDFRIFYTVDDAGKVWILRILHKDDTKQFYEEAER